MSLPVPTIVIPVRPFEQGKSRLAGVLAGPARVALNRHLFAHVLETACQVVGAAHCLVVSRSDEALAQAEALGARAIVERGNGLNAALAQARDAAVAAGAGAVVTLSTDLPLLGPDDVQALIALGQSCELVIASDRRGIGTNGLCLPDAAGFRFAYGIGSCAAHASQASRARILVRPGLACDLDVPDDLALFGVSGGRRRRRRHDPMSRW
jgi:2-phospho-L-lactate/phosphoenolpyruvate guanylyltransferase